MRIDNEELFFVPYSPSAEKVILYAPLRSYAALIPADSIRELTATVEPSQRWTGLLAHIKERRFIDITQLHQLARKAAPELGLAITDNCNLSCRYCHHAAGDLGKTSTMSRDLITRLIDSFVSSTDTKDLHISFAGGGEPTYAMPELAYAVAYGRRMATEMGKTVAFGMATNGCFGASTLEFLKANFSQLSLSFDGPEPIQNLHRPLKNGSPSFPLVYQTAQSLYDAKFSFAFRATVSDYSLKFSRTSLTSSRIIFQVRALDLSP